MAPNLSTLRCKYPSELRKLTQPSGGEREATRLKRIVAQITKSVRIGLPIFLLRRVSWDMLKAKVNIH